jgi:hypothetical protein
MSVHHPHAVPPSVGRQPLPHLHRGPVPGEAACGVYPVDLVGRDRVALELADLDDFGDVPAADIREATPETRYLPPEAADAWEQGLTSLRETIGHPEGARRVVELRRDIFRALHEGGAEFLMGTDSPQLFSVPGFSNHREMALWVELGMSPAEVIRAGTWNVARHFDELDVAGSVAEGRRADLILLESNPLDDIAALKQARAGVMMRGQWLPEAEIRERLEAIAQR